MITRTGCYTKPRLYRRAGKWCCALTFNRYDEVRRDTLREAYNHWVVLFGSMYGVGVLA